MGWLHFIRDTNRCVPPHPLRYAQHLPPSGGRLLLLRIFIMLDQSYQLSHSAMPDSRVQLCPRGTLIADQRRACAARPRGKAGSERRKACFHPGGSGFHLPRGWPGPLPVFIQLTFTSHTGSLLLSSLKKVTSPSFPPRPPSRPYFPDNWIKSHTPAQMACATCC